MQFPYDPPAWEPIPSCLNSVEEYTGLSRAEVFAHWLDYVLTSLRVIPSDSTMQTIRETGQSLLIAIERSAAFRESERSASLTAAFGDHLPFVLDAFRDALETALNVVSSPATTDGRSFVEANDLDLFGWLYQHYVCPEEDLCLMSFREAREKAAQMLPDGAGIAFTALDIALQIAEEEGDPIDAVMARAAVAAFFRSVTADRQACDYYMTSQAIPLVRQHLPPIHFFDPACGSGTLIMAASKRFPAFAVESGLVKLTGCDIDPICVRAAQINEILYGFNGFYLDAFDGEKTLPQSLIQPSQEAMPQYADLMLTAEDTSLFFTGDLDDLRRLGVLMRSVLEPYTDPAAVFPLPTSRQGGNR